MGRREKLLEELRNNPRGVRFEELEKLLYWYGFDLDTVRGSHHTYYRDGCPPITIIRRKPTVKEVYVKLALDLIDRHCLPEEQ